MMDTLAFAADENRPRRLLLWHWGRNGAGAKFTYELANAMQHQPATSVELSVSRGSELDDFSQALPRVETHAVTTFNGSKGTWRGKIAAAAAVLRIPRIMTQFRQQLAEINPDVVICTMQSIWDAAAIRALRRQSGRFILVLHDAKFHPGDTYPGRSLVLAEQVKAADALIVLSDHVRQQAVSIFNFPEERIWTLPHGAFSFGHQTSPRTLPHGRKARLLFMGRIAQYKGVGHLLDAYAILKRDNEPVELMIAGSGDMKPYERSVAQSPDVSVRNEWLSEADMADALSWADIVVLPYIEASQSGVAASALTAHVPIVATPVGGLTEQVQDGVTGVVAKGMSATDLADAIRSLTRDPDFYAACSARAGEYAQQELGWGAIARHMRKIVDTVVALPRRGTQS
jgi:glycosyltransferase involved in cell wall biosynthesis